MISKIMKKNFETLSVAFACGDAALMDVRRRSDGKSVSAIAACNRQEDGSIIFTPFAILVEGNPYEMFDPQNPDGGYFTESDDKE